MMNTAVLVPGSVNVYGMRLDSLDQVVGKSRKNSVLGPEGYNRTIQWNICNIYHENKCI